MTTTQPTEETTTMRVPPSPDATTPTDRTPEPVRVVHVAELLRSEAEGLRHESLAHPVANPAVAASLDDAADILMETITDRAAIRDSDEADEPRVNGGDKAWFDPTAVADWSSSPTATEAQIAEAWRRADADTIETVTTLLRSIPTLVAHTEAAEDALARVTREAEALRAQVAAVEAEVAVWESDRDVCLAWIADPNMHVDPEHPMRLSGMADILNRHAECIRAALATTGEGKWTETAPGVSVRREPIDPDAADALMAERLDGEAQR
jgi:hypothetical protein